MRQAWCFTSVMHLGRHPCVRQETSANMGATNMRLSAQHQIMSTLADAQNISCMKLIWRVLIPVLLRCRLIKKHQPYIIMEYVDMLTEYTIDGSKLTKYSILDICEEIDYVPFNLYGICVLDPEIFEELFLRI